MIHREQTEKLDQYYTDQMTPDERIDFEREIEADPSLKAESELQSTIVKGLKEYRKLQLKSRLDAIEFTTGWWEFAQQSVFVKSFGGIVIASAIGTGAYFIAQNNDLNDQIDLTEASSFVKPGEVVVPTFEVSPFEWVIEERSPSQVHRATNEVVVPTVESVVAQSSEEMLNAKPSAVSEPFVPVFEAPNPDEIEEVDVNTSALDEVVSDNNDEVIEAPLDIETVNNRSNKIKYKYYDGKLFLSGNFENRPYEIIEINAADGRRIYLLHNRKYYEVSITDRLKELPEVRNIKLIQELRLIKENK